MTRPTRIINRRKQREQKAVHRQKTWRRILLSLITTLFGLITITLCSGVVGITAVVSAFTQDLPDFTQIEEIGTNTDTFETTKIFARGPDSDGDGQKDWQLIYEVIDPLGGDRQWLPYGQLPADVINATVAIEDKTFWTNEGFDTQGIARAFYQYVWLGGEIQGGSSITQQLVKNNLIEVERRTVAANVTWDDYSRKAEELLLANQVADTYSKEQILEWYLNTNFYGNLAYGIEAAARVYFDKTAAELTLPEAAMLAAIPQSPALNPIDNPEPAKARQELVLEAMLREGAISREQFVAARFTPLEIRERPEDRFDITAPHYAIAVRKELEQKFGSEQVLRGGLRVYTALDLEWQAQAECVARAQIGRLSGELGAGISEAAAADCPALAFMPSVSANELGVDRQVNNAAVAMIDPRTGELKALVGSLDYWDESIDGAFNVAADGLRQPGSSFKPFTYLTALSQGYSAASQVLDVETDFGTPYNGVAYVPQNYDRLFRGPMRMRQALANSYNVPAVEVMTWVGADNVIRTAHQLGITSLDAGPNQYGLAVTLGGGEVKPLDMAFAFGVLANNGRMVGQPVPESEQRLGFRTLEPVQILRVENRQRQTIYEYSQPQQRDIIAPELTYILNDMMSDRQARCAAFGCPNPLELPNGRPAAAKTGTTNDYRDAWTVGYTPQLVTAVWVGNTDSSPMDEVPGSRGAAPIWHTLMAWALQDQPFEVWQRPSSVVERQVCTLSGQLPNGICPTANEFFVPGTEPTQIDNMVQKFQINRENGRLATIYTPPELIDTQTFVIYPEEAADWVREREIPQPPTEYDTVRVTDQNRGLVIDSPQPFAYLNGQITISGTLPVEDLAYYRIAFFEGLTPTNLQTLVDNQPPPEEGAPLAIWDVSQLDGLLTLLITAVKNDGSFAEVSIPVTIDRTPPEVTITTPFNGATFIQNDEWIVVRAEASDDLSLSEVRFFANGAGIPFATSTVRPFTESWKIRGTGCVQFTAVAIDAAGNETGSDPIEACVE